MVRDYSDNNWSRKFRYEPLIKVILRSILHWKKFPDNISKLFLTKKKRNECFPLTLQRWSTVADRFEWTLIHVITKSLIKPPKNWKSIDVSFFTSSENLSAKKPSKFLESHDISKQTLWFCLEVSRNHLVALWRKSLTAGHLAFTWPCLEIWSEASRTQQYYKLEEFVHEKSKIIFGIA